MARSDIPPSADVPDEGVPADSGGRHESVAGEVVARPPGWRDPRTAAALSALPGLGQLYNRQGGKAGFFSLAVLFTIGPAVLLIMVGEGVGTQLLREQRGALFLLFAFVSIVVFLGLLLLGLTFWASSIVDARRSAQELNRGDAAAAQRWWFFRL